MNAEEKNLYHLIRKKKIMGSIYIFLIFLDVRFIGGLYLE